MPAESLDLYAPWPLTLALVVGLAICGAVFVRSPRKVSSFLLCLIFGVALAHSLSQNLHLGVSGVTQSGLIGKLSLNWSEIADADFVERTGKGGRHISLRLTGSGGQVIELYSMDQLGDADAATLATYFRARLPGDLGERVAARLTAMQHDDADWSYRVAVTPGP